MTEKLIVNVNSMKGGVGKTTLALAIALEALSRVPAGRKKPVVVFIDADIFGTEIVDSLVPYEGKTPACWDLALLDVLVQSTGGDVTIRRYIEKRLRMGLREEGSLPLIPTDTGTGADLGRSLLLIPSLAWRDFNERQMHLKLSSHRLDLTLVAESMGRFQLELRLTALVTAILEVIEPELVVIDHAPFHFVLSEVSRRWSPKGLKELVLDEEARDPWNGYQVRHLEVAGPDQQDVLAFLAQMGDTKRREEAHGEKGTRWVLNRDVHLGDGRTFEQCNTGRLYPNELQRWTELGHVTLSPELFAGMHGRNITGVRFSDAGDFEWTVLSGNPLSYLELISNVIKKGGLRPWKLDDDSNFSQQDWWNFLQ